VYDTALSVSGLGGSTSPPASQPDVVEGVKSLASELLIPPAPTEEVTAELLPAAAAAPVVGADLHPAVVAASSAAPPSATSTPPASLASKIAVPAAPNKELRRSTRIAALNDVHTLHKAEGLAAKKNLELPGNSFASFPISKISSNLGRIGINLDTSAVVSIKNLEVDRLVLCANEKKTLYQI